MDEVLPERGRHPGNSSLVGSLGAVLLAFQAPGSDWLPCDGAAISRAVFSDLFALIGTTFGAGDGSTTFNLPTLAAPTAGLTYFMETAL